MFWWFCHVLIPKFCRSAMVECAGQTRGQWLCAQLPGMVWMWKTSNTVSEASGEICWFLFSFSMCPRNSAAWSYKELFHTPHQQRADFRDVVKHRFNFRIRIAPTDFWDSCSLENKQIWNGAAEERQGEEHSAGLKESAASLQCVSYVWNLKYHLLFDGLSILSVFSLFWKCVPNSCIICLLHQLTKHKEVGRSLSSRVKTLHEKMTQFLFSFTFLFKEAQDGTKSLHKCK